MRTRLFRTAVATAALAGSLGLTACSGSSDSSAGGSVGPQQLRNDAAVALDDAQQATLAPLATRLELLGRAEQRAELAGESTAVVAQQIAAYSSLAAAIEAAPSAETVRTLVAQSPLDLAEGNGDPTDAVVVVSVPTD